MIDSSNDSLENIRICKSCHAEISTPECIEIEFTDWENEVEGNSWNYYWHKECYDIEL